MKDYIIILVLFIALLFGTPAVFGVVKGENLHAGDNAESIGEKDFPKEISLFLTDSEEIIKLKIEDYLAGCLFAQIPANYHEQALKAQAVAAHTYALRLIADGVQLSDSAATCQPYFTEETARHHYGADYDEFAPAVQRAAKYGAARAILFDGEPIHAVYHSISAGATNAAYSVWGRDFPYLKSVQSSWDIDHPNYFAENELTAESIRFDLFDYNKTASMPIDYSLWFINSIENENGYVISVKAGDNLLSGGDMWRIFNLRSTCFEISFKSGGVFVIKTKGFGHGVGLSQYGADVLGRRGLSCEEILTYYYSDVEVVGV